MELKPCPFCGDIDPDIEELSINGLFIGSYCVECFNCHAKTDYFDTEEEAIEAWNRRIDNKT